MVFQKKVRFNVVFKNFFVDLLDFFLPNFCLICDSKIKRNFYSICDPCLSEMKVSSEFDLKNFYEHSLKPYNLISNFYSYFEFIKEEKIQKAVHYLKYNGKSKVGILLGMKLGEGLSKLEWIKDIDFIVPIPIHRIKKLHRGYNQSSFIAKGINLITQIPIEEKVIKRVRNTNTQTNLHLHERIENVKGAFKVINRKKVYQKNILLVDDVCTTGSTVNEIARTLLLEGTKRVDLATLSFVKEKDFSI